MIQIDLPEDVNEYVLDEQMQKKVEKGSGFYSKQQTIVFLLRESMQHKGFRPKEAKALKVNPPD